LFGKLFTGNANFSGADKEMGLWARLTRLFRAGTGAALDKIENPEMVLQQTIREMRERVPDLNNSVAQVMATERLLARSKEKLAEEVVDLDSKIKASIKMQRDDIATAYIGQFQQKQLELSKTSVQLEQAGVASKQALKARDNYVLNMNKRTAEAMQLISASKQAKLQEQLAQTMETFNIGDDASTFNEMREKIDRRVAAAEAKLQLGSSNVDAQMQDIEREAMDIQLQDKLLEYKQQMGLLGSGATTGGKQISAASEVSESETLDQVLLNESKEK
jgi:phage shock protein A